MKTPKNSKPTAFMWNLCLFFTTLRVKKIVTVSYLNFPWCLLWPLLFLPSLPGLRTFVCSHLGVAVGSPQVVPAFSVPEETAPSASPCARCPCSPWPPGLSQGWSLLGSSGSCWSGVPTWAPGVCRVALPESSQAGITPVLLAPIPSGVCPSAWALSHRAGAVPALPSLCWEYGALLSWGTALLSCPGPDEVCFGPILRLIPLCLCL